jgi:glycosyltransferase involved in cell wall biosynthesis
MGPAALHQWRTVRSIAPTRPCCRHQRHGSRRGWRTTLDIGPDGERPLRILVVTNLYPSERHPAFGTFVGARVAALRATGQHVDVAAILDDRAHQRVWRKYLGLMAHAARAAVRARIGRRPYDIVEAHIAFPTGVLAWLTRVLGGGRLVLFCHGSDVLRLAWSNPVSARLARWSFRRADLVIANSQYVADAAERRLGPLRRLAVVSPGIADVAPSSVDASSAREPGSILFVGRLVDGKGIAVLVEALRLMTTPDRHLTVIGDGPQREELEGRVREAGTGAMVTFRGGSAPAEVRATYGRTQVVAVPSIEPEGLNLVALEAMAAGAVVVATAAGGLAETMRDGDNGIVIPPADAVALAAALDRAIRIAAGPEGDRMRAAARATAAAHSLDQAVATTVALFRGLGR